MKPELAQFILVTLVSNSHFLKGVLYGKSAWGALGFPDPVKEKDEFTNLVKLFRDMADGIEGLQEQKGDK